MSLNSFYEVSFLLRLFCISTKLPFAHVWNTVVTCGLMTLLGIVSQTKKRICRTVGPSLAGSLKPLPECRNVASLSLSHRYFFGRCYSEMAQLVPLPFSRGSFFVLVILIHSMIFLSPQMLQRCTCQQFLSSQRQTRIFCLQNLFF